MPLYLEKLSALCAHIMLEQNLGQDLEHNSHTHSTVHCLKESPHDTAENTLFHAAKIAQEWGCTHLMSLEILEDSPALLEDVAHLLDAIPTNSEAILNGTRDFTAPSPWRMRFERCMSSFWMRVQTGEKVCDMHSSLRVYPLSYFAFAKIQNSGYTFEAEALVRAAWGGYEIQEIPVHMPSPHTWKGPTAKEYLALITLNTRLTMRALMPLPFKRYNNTRQEAVSLKRPLESLRRLMDDPYNRANPRELARTAAIAIAVLTVPAPIVQSVALLLFIGWFRLNRLCALAMIPFTWPPFLPAIAILLGYRVRHGHWLNEFSVQTLGYEAGQRLWEWVIGSLLLTPVFAVTAGIAVGALAYSVAGKKT